LLVRYSSTGDQRFSAHPPISPYASTSTWLSVRSVRPWPRLAPRSLRAWNRKKFRTGPSEKVENRFFSRGGGAPILRTRAALPTGFVCRSSMCGHASTESPKDVGTLGKLRKNSQFIKNRSRTSTRHGYREMNLVSGPPPCFSRMTNEFWVTGRSSGYFAGSSISGSVILSLARKAMAGWG